MADVKSDIREFLTYVHKAAQDLSQLGVPARSWKSEAGQQVVGWAIDYGDLPRSEDIVLGRNPIYMGGSWGHWDLVLGIDGIIYECRFSGQDTYENGQIVTRTGTRIEKSRVSDLMGRGARFSQVRRQIDRVIADNFEQ